MNIFNAKNSGNDTYVCKVVIKLGDTLCSVKDRRGRKFNAESNGSYKPGEWVIVKNGVIVGRSRKVRVVNHYNV